MSATRKLRAVTAPPRLPADLVSDPDRLLTVAEVAALLQTSAWTVRRLISEGKLPARLSGRAWRVRLADYRAYVGGLPAA